MSETVITQRGKRVGMAAGLLATGLAIGIAHHEAAPTPQEKRIEKIIESPQNIPEGHKITITVDHTGDGPIAISQQIASKGHIEDLAAELKNEEVDGYLPAGNYPVYDRFVEPQHRPDVPGRE